MCVCMCLWCVVCSDALPLSSVSCVWWTSALPLVAFRALAQSHDLLGVLQTKRKLSTYQGNAFCNSVIPNGTQRDCAHARNATITSVITIMLRELRRETTTPRKLGTCTSKARVSLALYSTPLIITITTSFVHEIGRQQTVVGALPLWQHREELFGAPGIH